MYRRHLFFPMEDYDAKVGHILTEIENTSACLGGPVHNHYCVLLQEERVFIIMYRVPLVLCINSQ